MPDTLTCRMFRSAARRPTYGWRVPRSGLDWPRAGMWANRAPHTAPLDTLLHRSRRSIDVRFDSRLSYSCSIPYCIATACVDGLLGVGGILSPGDEGRSVIPAASVWPWLAAYSLLVGTHRSPGLVLLPLYAVRAATRNDGLRSSPARCGHVGRRKWTSLSRQPQSLWGSEAPRAATIMVSQPDRRYPALAGFDLWTGAVLSEGAMQVNRPLSSPS